MKPHRPRRLKRLAGTTLQRIRKEHFRKFPLCVHCEARGIVRLAVELDHIVALANDGRDAHDNRQGLCKECHAVKTAQDLGYRQRSVTGPDGFPIE